MKVTNVIERAEKYRLLGRFDKISGIAFINDALYDICMMQSIKREEIFYGYTGLPFKLMGEVIKVESVDLEVDEPKQFNVRIMQNNEIILYKLNHEGKFVQMTFEDHVKIPRITVVYTGFIRVIKPDQNIDFPAIFETAIVYFVRSKMLEEVGEVEQAQYFENQYMKQLIMKSSPKTEVISKPSPYSLM